MCALCIMHIASDTLAIRNFEILSLYATGFFAGKMCTEHRTLAYKLRASA